MIALWKEPKKMEVVKKLKCAKCKKSKTQYHFPVSMDHGKFQRGYYCRDCKIKMDSQSNRRRYLRRQVTKARDELCIQYGNEIYF
jgi:hypothetical protein